MTAYIVSVSQPLVFEVEAVNDLSARAAIAAVFAHNRPWRPLTDSGTALKQQGWPVIDSVTEKVGHERSNGTEA